MEVTAFLKSESITDVPDRIQKLILNHSRLINCQKSYSKKAINFSRLKTGFFYLSNYDPFTLIIIMGPAASLTYCYAI